MATINHGVTTSMYYRHPGNNRVELQVDNFATPAELDSCFKSRAFAKHPVGVTYDPEELCRRYEAGDAMADLLRIPPLPARQDPLGHAGEPLNAATLRETVRARLPPTTATASEADARIEVCRLRLSFTHACFH